MLTIPVCKMSLSVSGEKCGAEGGPGRGKEDTCM